MGAALAFAWLLNFDADDELADPSQATLSHAAKARMRELRSLVTSLFGPDDIVIEDGTEPEGAARFEGRAWCPTPRALAAIDRAGVNVPASPTLAILRAANDRGLSASLGFSLPGACFVHSREEAAAAIREPPPADALTRREGPRRGPGFGAACGPILIGHDARTSPHWLLKRAFGFAGRGHRRVACGSTDSRDLAWIETSFARGDGLAVEPRVERRGDFGLHGHLSAGGTLTKGAPTFQVIDAHGTWRSTRLATSSELGTGERDALDSAFAATASALVAVGYFGPFGIDAFRWVNSEGEESFHPLCEINARYSMGWAIGMGALRPDR